jgi:hypothetical protein
MKQQRVVYIHVSENNPNTTVIDETVSRMADEGLALLNVVPSQSEGGATVGLWLFFVDANQAPAWTPSMQSMTRTSYSPPLSTINASYTTEMPAQTLAFWWQEVRTKKGLGLSLTLTGIASVIIGILLHFALREQWIDTTLRLGYFFGVVGLFLFLIGMVILF